MEPVIYSSAGVYIASCKDAKAKIVAIDKIIDALLITAADAAGNDNVSEYMLDSGQTKIKTMYRGSAAVLAGIKGFEALKEFYIAKINGRQIRLVDSKSVGRGGRC